MKRLVQAISLAGLALTTGCQLIGGFEDLQGGGSTPLDPRCQVLGSEDDDAVELGAVLPLTTAEGTPDLLGPYWRNALDLVAVQTNPPHQQGVASGRSLRFTVCDTTGDATQAPDLAQILVDRGVPAIVSGSSGDTLLEAGVTVPAGVLLLAGAATTPELSTLLDESPDHSVGLVWRTVPSSVFETQVMAGELMTLHADLPSVTVFARNDAFGQGTSGAFQSAYTGASHVVYFDPVVAGSSDTTPAAVAQAASQFTGIAVVIGMPSDIFAVLNSAAKDAHYDHAEWFLTQGAKSPTLFDSVTNPTLEGAFVTAPASSPGSAAYRFFAPLYDSAYGTAQEPDPLADTVLAPYFYDAGMLAVLAAEVTLDRGADLDGTNLAHVLTQVSVTSAAKTPLDPIMLGAAASALLHDQPVNVDGASGPLDFDPQSGEAEGAIDVFRIEQGDFTLITTAMP
ncbi:MAG TPA: hypothetical protein VGM56_15945 [Byssovorax sp.]|jgi:branched-chain amino acid transport system substrate-binding protein